MNKGNIDALNPIIVDFDYRITFFFFHNLSNSTSKNPTRFQQFITKFWRMISFTNDGWIPCILFLVAAYDMWKIYQNDTPLDNIPLILFELIPLNYVIYYFSCFFVDVLFVGCLKLFYKRKRPRNDVKFIQKFEKFIKPMDSIERNLSFWEVEQGPDEFSFPSGHASRSTYIFLLFLYHTSPSSVIGMITISLAFLWTCCICLSRLCLGRHFFIDIMTGVFVGTITFSISSLLTSNIIIPTTFSILKINF